MNESRPSYRLSLPNRDVGQWIDVIVVSATQARNARMAHSTGVRRTLPPRRSRSHAQAASASSESTRATNTLIKSNWSRVKGR